MRGKEGTARSKNDQGAAPYLVVEGLHFRIAIKEGGKFEIYFQNLVVPRRGSSRRT